MLCKECRNEIGTKTICPFCGDAKKGGRFTKSSSSGGLNQRCDWHRNVCGMIGTIREGGTAYLCTYHHHLMRVLDGGMPVGFDEQADFEEWVDRYRPGRAYGRNPGQWWPATGLLLEVIKGQAALPVQTARQREELYTRELFAWYIINKKPLPGPMKDRRWLNDGILPPFPPRWLLNLQTGGPTDVEHAS